VIEQQYVLEMNMPETVYEKCDYVFERESVEISTDCDASV